MKKKYLKIVLIIYRAKEKAKLIAYSESFNEPKTDMLFGMWSDKQEDIDNEKSVDDIMVRNIRKSRKDRKDKVFSI